MTKLSPIHRDHSHQYVKLLPGIPFLLFATFISLSPIWLGLFGISGNLIFLCLCLLFIISRVICRSGLQATMLFFSFFCSAISALLIIYTSIKINFFISILVLFLILFVLLRHGKELIRLLSDQLIKIFVSKKCILFLLIMLALAFLHSLFWQVITFKFIIYFVTSIFVTSYLDKRDLLYYTEVATRMHLIIIVFSIIGFFYAAAGGAALFSIVNEDGRENGFYLTTFSNTYLLGFIRPSGIYDEPGALSFILCGISLLRDALGLDRRRTLLLLFLGLVTSSVAHLIFLIFYIVGGGIRNQIRFLIYSLVFLSLIISYEPSVLSIFNEFSSRFAIVDGSLSGDNRSDLLNNAISYFSPSVALFGLDSNCMLNNSMCESMNYDKYGENPLTPIVHYGALLSFPYYLALILLVFYAIKVRSLAAFGFMLILLQRPYVLSYGYSLIIVICICALHIKLTEIQNIR